MAVHQCPRCPLRFSFRTELEFHLREDHSPEPTEGAGEAAESTASPAVGASNGRVPAAMLAAAAVSPVGLKESDRPRWPYYGLTVEATVDEPARDDRVADERLPELTLMPRRVVVAVIVIVIALLAIGAFFGS